VRISKVKHHALREISSDALEGYRRGAPFKELRTDPVTRDNWVSFTAVEWNTAEDCLYVGMTAFDTDLLWRFWPDSGEFESLGFKDMAPDPRYLKIHRGLTSDGQGGYYFGTAGLIDLDERNEAPGGAVYHYSRGQFELLGIPLQHDYIQNIEVDLKRGRVYGVTYPVIRFFDYDFKKRKTLFSFFTGSHFHESGLDDDGYFWGTWSTRRGHCLFRYHPDVGEPEFFDESIPNLDPDHLFNFPMNGPIDSCINGGDGYLYFGTTLGELYQLDPRIGKHVLLGKPTDGIRLSGLTASPGGRLLGSYGAYNETGLFTYDRKTGEFSDLGAVRDDDASCFMIHDIAWDGGSRVFAAETDNVDRSSYLWEVHLEDS
jgi:hypothetical protein